MPADRCRSLINLNPLDCVNATGRAGQASTCSPPISGRSAWFVGVLVLMVYVVFAMTLCLLPPRFP
jgi:hypothetical protein